MGTEFVGDRLSRGTNQLGTNCGGPNVRGPYVFACHVIAVKIDLVYEILLSRELEFHCTVVLSYDGRKLNGFDLKVGLCF